MQNFWTIWKFMGLAIVAMDIVLLLAVFLLASLEQKQTAMVAMLVLSVCILPLAVIDIYRAR